MTDRDEAYRLRLKAFLESEVCPQVEEWERTSYFPRESIQRLGEMGFFAPCLREVEPKEGQVQPLRLSRFKVLIEELAKTRCFGLTISVSIHVGIFLPMLARLAHPDVRDEILEGGLKGRYLGTFALTEAESSGSDFAGIETNVAWEDDKITLNGNKHYIINAAVADYIIVFARWRPGRHFSNFCALLVPTSLPGIRRYPIPMEVLKTAVVSGIDFDEVVLPATCRMGRKQLGMYYFLDHVLIARLSAGIWAVAVAEGCLEETQRFLAERRVGDRTLWDRSSVRIRMAHQLVRVRLLHGLVEKVVRDADERGTIDALDSAVIKAASAPAMERVIGTCVQLQGARGLEEGSVMLRVLKEFRTFGLAGGSTEVMLEIVSDILGRKASGKEISKEQWRL